MRGRVPLVGLLVAAVLALGVLFFGLYRPWAVEAAQLRTENQQLATRQEQLRHEVEALLDSEARQVELRAQLVRLEEAIPSGLSQPAVIREFQARADAAGVEITSVAFGQPVLVEPARPTGDPGTALAEVPVTMVLSGGYFQAVDFLRRLDSDMTRAVLVETVNIVEHPDGFPTLAVTWNGQLFAIVSVAEAMPAPPEEAPAPAGAMRAPSEEAP